MNTWLQNFLNEVEAVDLTLPCQTTKRIDTGDTVLGELNEYMQKLYRLRESYRLQVEDFREKMDDIKAVCDTELKLGILKNHVISERVLKAKDLFDHFKARFFVYHFINDIFNQELEFHFPFQIDLFKYNGIRDGKILIGRNDNSRGDDEGLDDYYVRHQLILEFEKMLKK